MPPSRGTTYLRNLRPSFLYRLCLLLLLLPHPTSTASATIPADDDVGILDAEEEKLRSAIAVEDSVRNEDAQQLRGERRRRAANTQRLDRASLALDTSQCWNVQALGRTRFPLTKGSKVTWCIRIS